MWAVYLCSNSYTTNISQRVLKAIEIGPDPTLYSKLGERQSGSKVYTKISQTSCCSKIGGRVLRVLGPYQIYLNNRISINLKISNDSIKKVAYHNNNIL